MSNTMNQTAVERADALLTRWTQRLNPTDSSATQPAVRDEAGQGAAPPPPSGRLTPEAEPEAVGRADSLLGRVGHRLSGRGLVEAAAYGYVALAIRTGRVADAVQAAWQESVRAARTQQIQQAEQAGGRGAARQAATDERSGENILKGVEKDVAQDAAKDVEAAAEAAV